MSFSIHTATERDVDDIVHLVNEAYRGESGKRGWTTEADLLGGLRTDREGVEELLAIDGSVMLIAREGKALIGCVNLKKKNATSAYLGMLTVQVDTQSRGAGSEILKASEDFVRREWGAREIEMNVITTREELISWYERRGYKKTGEIRPFPRDERFGIPLKGTLEFCVMTKPLR